jgi:hypothetical protein
LSNASYRFPPHITRQVRADYRFIDSNAYALPFSLRFPRIKRVRYDKSFLECMSDREARDLLESSKSDPLVNLEFTTANMLRCNEKSTAKKRSGSVHQANHLTLSKQGASSRTYILPGCWFVSARRSGPQRQ